MTKREAVFTKDFENRKISVVRTFDASLDRVWQAWTNSETLDKWWAPKPYRAVTKEMDFREGGHWLYAMTGPEGNQQWCIENFKTIATHQSITNDVSFCDEQGVATKEFPVMHWKKSFSEGNQVTTVTVEITYDKVADMEMIINMGMQEGFTAALNNLDELV